jgi:hypothetical protein
MGKKANAYEYDNKFSTLLQIQQMQLFAGTVTNLSRLVILQ